MLPHDRAKPAAQDRPNLVERFERATARASLPRRIIMVVCGVLFLVPAISRMLGLPGEPPATEPAILGTALAANDRRADHLRATLTRGRQGETIATAFPVQDSAMLQRLARADALILRAPHAPALPQGAEVAVIRLESHGI